MEYLSPEVRKYPCVFISTISILVVPSKFLHAPVYFLDRFDHSKKDPLSSAIFIEKTGSIHKRPP